jgi:hypothetical protein
MKKTTLFVLAGLAVMVLVFYSASIGSTPAATLGDLVEMFFSTFPRS